MKYRCSNIAVHNGELRDVHRNLFNKACTIHTLNKGFPAQIISYLDDSDEPYRYITTSTVQSWTEEFDKLTIDTKNTTYTFEKLCN